MDIYTTVYFFSHSANSKEILFWLKIKVQKKVDTKGRKKEILIVFCKAIFFCSVEERNLLRRSSPLDIQTMWSGNPNVSHYACNLASMSVTISAKNSTQRIFFPSLRTFFLPCEKKILSTRVHAIKISGLLIAF